MMIWNGWRLSTLRAYEATNDPDYLAAAGTLWTDIKTGVNDNQGGGIAWRKSQLDYKNTPANAPAIIFAARLYRLQKNEADLTLAKELYTWLKATLVDPSSGIVWDGINGNHDGQISKNKFTYNQGTFIGAALELYNATGDALLPEPMLYVQLLQLLKTLIYHRVACLKAKGRAMAACLKVFWLDTLHC
jgi:predicted alpha-1,6-mannanase (GH76 family)